MGVKEIIEGKKAWRAHTARVKALPQDYQIVYKEIQNYLFKVAPIDLSDGINGMGLFSGILDLLEEGAASGKNVLSVTGRDVAAFCDGLIEGAKTYADTYQDSVNQEVGKSIKKSMEKKGLSK